LNDYITSHNFSLGVKTWIMDIFLTL
jgi:hypothetical protein